MKKKLRIIKFIILAIYILIAVDLIVSTAMFGFHNIHFSAFIFIVFSVFTAILTFGKKQSKEASLIFAFLSVFKLFATLAPEIFLDIIMNSYNFADDGLRFLPIFLYIVLVFVLFFVEAVYAGLNFALLREEK